MINCESTWPGLKKCGSLQCQLDSSVHDLKHSLKRETTLMMFKIVYAVLNLLKLIF